MLIAAAADVVVVPSPSGRPPSTTQKAMGHVEPGGINLLRNWPLEYDDDNDEERIGKRRVSVT